MRAVAAAAQHWRQQQQQQERRSAIYHLLDSSSSCVSLAGAVLYNVTQCVAIICTSQVQDGLTFMDWTQLLLCPTGAALHIGFCVKNLHMSQVQEGLTFMDWTFPLTGLDPSYVWDRDLGPS
jgi:hypothetical protein